MTRSEYLERLRDLLPAREAPRILADVESLLLDRMEAAEKDHGLSTGDAEQAAIRALGAPEALAGQLLAPPIQIDRNTRREFFLWFAVVSAGHLLLSILLTAAGTEQAALPRLFGPLDRSSVPTFLSGVLAILLMDAGAVFVFFAFLGRGRVPKALPRMNLSTSWTRRDSGLALVMLALIAVLLHPSVRDTIMAVRHGGQVYPLLSSEVTGVLLPWAWIVAGLYAVRHLLIFVSRGETAPAVAVDAVASLATVVLLVLVATRGEIVRLPESLGPETGDVLDDLLTRVFLLVLVGSALLLTVRSVKRLVRLRDHLAA